MNERLMDVSVGDAATVGEKFAPPAETIEHIKFKDYVVEAKLGEGSFGKVYRAHHIDSPETSVALKVIPTQGKFEELLREPTMLAALNHPGIIRVLDYFPHANKEQLVLALEYVGGGDLKTAIDESTLFPEAVVRDFLTQMARALQHAHQHGIVHRDLKPANILLDRDGIQVRYVLSDFGVGLQHQGVRSEKKVAGTYLYMAPEQLRGRPVPESDLWSLGVIAYRMLTGQYPFPGPTPVELMKQIQLTTPALPSTVRGADIDHQLERVVLRLLDRSETERIGSASELLKLLGTMEEGSSYSTKPSASGASRISQRVQSLETALQQGIRRNFVWMIVWFVMMLLVSGIVKGVFTTMAMALVYHAHSRKRMDLFCYIELLLAAALLGTLLIVGFHPEVEELSLQFIMLKLITYYHWPLDILSIPLSILYVLLSWFLPIWACERFGRINQLKRDKMLLFANRTEASSEEYLQTLKDAVDYRFEDVTFHLKYAEALAAQGDDRSAAVEARLLLDTDPYHFVGNLFLAQCCYRLGLYQDSKKVCEDYLSVTGYSFEFSDLRDECLRRLGERS